MAIFRQKNKTMNQNTMASLLLLPAIVLIVLFVVIPLFRNIGQSFLDYTNTNDPSFAGFSNYRKILTEVFNRKENVTQIAFKNSFRMMLVVTPLTVFMSYLLARSMSMANHVYKVIVGVLLLIGSLIYFYPIGLYRIFRGDVYGYINSYLLNSGKISQPIIFSSDPRTIQVFLYLLPVLTGLGPLYLLFTTYFLRKERFIPCLYGATIIQVLINIFSFISRKVLFGSPSADYLSYTIGEHAYASIGTIGERGYVGALFVLFALFVVLILAVFLGTIAIFNRLKKPDLKIIERHERHPNQLRTSQVIRTIIVPILVILLALILVFPLVLMFFDSLKSMEDLFRFPPKMLPRKITFEAYKHLNDEINLNQAMKNSWFVFLLSFFIHVMIFSMSAIGIDKLHERTQKYVLRSVLVIGVLSIIPFVAYSNHGVFGEALHSTVTWVIPYTIQGVSFGFGIYVSSTLWKKLSGLHDKVLSSVMLSLLFSLLAWMNTIYATNTKEGYTLIHLLDNYYYTSRFNAVSALYFIGMMIPFLIIIVATPLFIYSTSRKRLKQTN